MAKLKANGMPGMKMFTKEDFEGLSPEQMAEKVLSTEYRHQHVMNSTSYATARSQSFIFST
jgi:hypothetical protein